METKSIHITIDGRDYEARPGEKIIDVINRNDIFHPQICYYPEVDPIQTCDTCIAEVNGELMRTCSTAAEDGMVVHLSDDRSEASPA